MLLVLRISSDDRRYGSFFTTAQQGGRRMPVRARFRFGRTWRRLSVYPHWSIWPVSVTMSVDSKRRLRKCRSKLEIHSVGMKSLSDGSAKSYCRQSPQIHFHSHSSGHHKQYIGIFEGQDHIFFSFSYWSSHIIFFCSINLIWDIFSYLWYFLRYGHYKIGRFRKFSNVCSVC